MAELKASDKEEHSQGSEKESFSEMNEFEHNRNPVASAQKQMASQETIGVLEQE
ncbi:hypothetical protein [Paenibacillus elgii]|uniref:hypothetical protein n=1 Tax=Paenibacillus elgii TaxID=189691 RepID=UPI00203EBBD1|nr:hypothetical protein [Paenibacillus elgii]MCM3268677.1 hypothetical protein [Paenibacillus elgii]